MDQSRIESEMHELETKLGYRFKNISLLSEAMKSQKLEKLPGDGDNHDEYSNEAMAFLGDTIIKFLLAEYLYGDGNNKRKGAMTVEKANLEMNQTMHSIMTNKNLILYSYNSEYFYKDNPPDDKKVVSGKHDPYIEAIVAAIYRDGGLDAVTDWFKKWLLPLLKECKDVLPQKTSVNPVGELKEWAQKNGGMLKDDYHMQGEDHKPTWTCILKLQLKSQDYTSRAEGADKTTAKKEAARKILEQLKI